MDNENNQFPNLILKERKVIKISRKKIIWVIVIIVVLFLLFVLVGTRTFNSTRIKSPGAYSMSVPEFIMDTGVSNKGGYSSEMYPNYDLQQPTIEDPREFLKMNYSSSVETRKVSRVVTDIKNIVKGQDGRVDRFNSSEKSGYVSFIVDKDKFENLREQIEGLTHKKLYTENVSAENLLSQKQSIEEWTASILSTLASLNSQKESLNAKHVQTVNTINKELTRIQKELSAVRTNITTTTDSFILTSLRSQETSYVQQEATQKKKLNEENSNYSAKLQGLESQITNANSNLTNASKEDTKFTNNVETVNGYVRVNWISHWQLIKTFSPIHPTLIIIILIIIGWISIRHKKFVPKIVVE